MTAPVYGHSGLVTKRYRMYLRQADTYTTPPTESDYTTFKATFDGDASAVEVGVREDRKTLITLTPKTTIDIDGGRKKVINYDGTAEAVLLNVTEENQDYLDSLVGISVDALFEDIRTKKSIVVLNCPLSIEENDTSGQQSTRTIRMQTEVDCDALTDFRDFIWHESFTA